MLRTRRRPAVVLTHGWGATSTEWYYPKKHLADRFRLIVWDLPGLGLSKKPDNNDYRLEKLAADLEAVLAFAGDRPAVLVGHSIGGMITLTFCRLFPEALGRRVAGLVLVAHDLHQPRADGPDGGLYTALEKPVIVPLPLPDDRPLAARLADELDELPERLGASVHARQSFAGTETRGQLDFVARFMPTARPDVLARGMLGMIAYDATATLPTIGVPVLAVVGDRDTMTLPEAGQFIARSMPRVRARHARPGPAHGPDRAPRAVRSARRRVRRLLPGGECGGVGAEVEEREDRPDEPGSSLHRIGYSTRFAAQKSGPPLRSCSILSSPCSFIPLQTISLPWLWILTARRVHFSRG